MPRSLGCNGEKESVGQHRMASYGIVCFVAHKKGVINVSSSRPRYELTPGKRRGSPGRAGSITDQPCACSLFLGLHCIDKQPAYLILSSEECLFPVDAFFWPGSGQRWRAHGRAIATWKGVGPVTAGGLRLDRAIDYCCA
jgi:hypothetical protein